nr:MAG TPA: hypothetical protein [Caudoviricetes sp.]
MAGEGRSESLQGKALENGAPSRAQKYEFKRGIKPLSQKG